MRIVTVHLLLDIEDDAEACDFCSETLGGMPYVIDWAHYGKSVAYQQNGEYAEGDFIQAADAARKEQ